MVLSAHPQSRTQVSTDDADVLSSDMRRADVSPYPLRRDLGAGYDVTIPLPGCSDDQLAMRHRQCARRHA
jgi:hypothetical protein